MLVSVWAFSAIFSCLHLLGFGTNFNFYPGTWCFLNYLGKSVLDRASAFVFAIFGILVILVIVISNCVVIVTLCRTKLSRSTRSQVSIAVYFVVLVTLFLVCTAPVMITMLSFAAQWTTEKDPKDNTAVALAVTNAIFDSWIYILLRKETLTRIRIQITKLRSCLPWCQENQPDQLEESVADSGETPVSVQTEVDVV
ncbi:thromboxane A2 receptor-like [Saccostrea echinata]|uniref:thromboxane A2 receptor-like n=1 Tax=Saccostrea echinata TaxID=191078 RepID=UPI002A7F6A32|nr:thromboxane A2 receptor-like [Saccostrea echinata]XP_061183546.1 thromboxane A2 receptor-like [Saccostrea echinata]